MCSFFRLQALNSIAVFGGVSNHTQWALSEVLGDEEWTAGFLQQNQRLLERSYDALTGEHGRLVGSGAGSARAGGGEGGGFCAGAACAVPCGGMLGGVLLCAVGGLATAPGLCHAF